MLKYFLIFAVLLVLLTLFADYSMMNTVGVSLSRQARERLERQSAAAARYLSNHQLPISSEKLKEVAREWSFDAGHRFDILDEGGQLVFSAIPPDGPSEDSEQLNQRNKPEIISGIQSGSGYAVRGGLAFSATSFQDSSGQPLGIVRVVESSALLERVFETLRRFLWCFSGLIGILTAITMALFSRDALQPLSQFADVARQIGAGKLDAKLSLLGRQDDWGALSDAFRHMQSELKRRELSIVDNSSRLQAVLSSMIEGVVAIDRQGLVMLANGAACKMLGISHGEIFGRDFLEIFRVPELTTAINRTQQERSFSKCEFQTRDGPRRTIAARVSVLTNETSGSRPGVAIVLHAITDLRQLENMRRDFVANVSHELKTPLSSIRAYAETLKLGAINDKKKNLHFVEQIEQQADILNNQIQELLQLARVESGQQHWEVQKISIDDICEALILQFASEADSRSIYLKFTPDKTKRFVHADHQGVKTIIGNLISNALHYTADHGNVEVRVCGTPSQIQIEVIDDGIGISEDHHARIFERFYRVDAARSRDHGGTGLGLSIVKHLCLAFQGSVELESRLGAGSRFIVKLPAVTDI